MAAFFVVCHHWTLVSMPMSIHYGYMSDNDPLFLQLPIIRLAISGPAQVCVFFVISGYALSYKPLRLIQQKKAGDFAAAVASSTFRRYLRLFLPPLITSFTVACLAYYKVYQLYEIPGVAITEFDPPALDTFWEQVKGWWRHFSNLSDPLAKDIERGRGFPYQPVLWTIPAEYDGSLVIFLAHVAFYRLRPKFRVLFTVCLTVHSLVYGRWQIFLFFSGLLLATVKFYSQDAHAAGDIQGQSTGWHTLPLASKPWRLNGLGSFRPSLSAVLTPPRLDIPKKVLQVVSFVFGLYLLSFPEGTNTPDFDEGFATPGYGLMTAWTPVGYGDGTYFWIPLAAVYLVFAIDRSPFIQPLFTNRFMQYLGRISYAVYLVHNSLLWIFGWHLLVFFARVTGTPLEASTASWGWGFCVVLSTCFFLAGTVCVADFVQRYVDAKAVRFAAWFEGKLVDKTK